MLWWQMYIEKLLLWKLTNFSMNFWKGLADQCQMITEVIGQCDLHYLKYAIYQLHRYLGGRRSVTEIIQSFDRSSQSQQKINKRATSLVISKEAINCFSASRSSEQARLREKTRKKKKKWKHISIKYKVEADIKNVNNMEANHFSPVFPRLPSSHKNWYYSLCASLAPVSAWHLK